MASQQNSLKTPPVLVDEDHYGEWISDLGVWLLYTDLAKEKQGPAVYLSLPASARECVRDLKHEEIGHADGVTKITNKQDSVFLKDENTRVYLAFK